MDINKVWLSGLVVSRPILTRPHTKAPIAAFRIQVNEEYTNHSGVAKVKPNIILVEALGRASAGVMEKVQLGLRYYIDGYIRQDVVDGAESMKVRLFAVYREETGDGAVYSQALRQTLEILKRSRDLSSAVGTLEELLATR
jgi:single-stranded DNA-binding protein